jgi:hypothetical protein
MGWVVVGLLLLWFLVDVDWLMRWSVLVGRLMLVDVGWCSGSLSSGSCASLVIGLLVGLVVRCWLRLDVGHWLPGAG